MISNVNKTRIQKRKEINIYTCDICNTEMTLDDTYKISMQHKKKNQKIYDLCEKCYGLMIKSVEKYKEGREEK